MTNKKVYDLVKQILETHPATRNSNKLLWWQVMTDLGLADNAVFINDFMAGPDYESVTRARRLIVAYPKYQHLRGNLKVENFRKQKQKSKGTFAFRETVTIIDPLTGVRQVLKGQDET